MRRRTRLIAGLLGLMAVTFSLSEMVLATMCAPGTGMDMPGMVEARAPAGEDMSAGSHEREHRDGGEKERQCPFGPAVTAGCTAVATIPSHVTSDFSPHLQDEGPVFAELSEHDLLVASALFHPPRA